MVIVAVFAGFGKTSVYNLREPRLAGIAKWGRREAPAEGWVL